MAGSRFWIVVFLIILVFMLVGVAYYSDSFGLSGRVTGESCPQDAFQCSDGTFVSRNPDNGCEFDPCLTAEERHCADLQEGQCKLDESCEPIYIYKGCKENDCNNPPEFSECVLR